MRFAVLMGHGPGWDPASPLRSQQKWDEHAAFMDALVEDGFVVLGGPLGVDPVTSALLIVEATSEDEIRDRLGADPWIPMRLLTIDLVSPWTILLGDPASLAR